MADDDQRKLALRFQEQCYLMKFWKTIVEQGVALREASGGYENFFILSAKNPYEYNNILFRKTDKSEKLMELSSAQLSALVPYVRIFKEVKDPISKQSIAIDLPFDDITQRKKIKNMMNSASGRGGGVGLKSFSWKSLGTNPANKYSFSAEMVLHFQDIGELFETRNTAIMPSGDQIEVAFSDLILSQAKFRKGENEGSMTYNRDYYRIKAICGWDVMRNLNIPLIKPDLIDVINDTKAVFYLSLHSHEIDFKEDGTLDLKINYIAYTDALAADPIDSNILYEDAKTKKLRKEISDNIQKNNDKLEKAKAAEDKEEFSFSGLFKDKNSDLIQESIDKQEAELKKTEASTRDLSYRRILSGLYEKGKIYSITAENDFFAKNLEVVLKQPENTPAGIVEVKEGEADTANRNQQAGPTVQAGAVDEAINGKPVSGLSEADSAALASNQVLEISNQVSLAPDGMRIVKFFYLGDLLDVVLNGMFSDDAGVENARFSEKDVRVILGNVSFVDYGSEEDSGFVMRDQTALKDQKTQYNVVMSGKRESVNIADIPISVRVFSAWFRNNIMEKQLTQYKFKDFIDSVVNDLVIRSLASDCFERAPRQKARLRYKTFSTPLNQKREELFKNGAATIDDFVREKCEFKVGLNRQDLQNQKSNLQTYLLIYGDKENPYQLKGNITQDREKGIYHLYFGNELGLVKRMQFNREDMPAQREANLYNNLNGKHSASKILREKYNVNIEMVGNNLFDVGSKVNIHPTIPGNGGLEAREKVLLDLGVGGYFDIVETQSIIEDGSYKTTLDAKWQARGDGTANIGDKEIELIPASEISDSSQVKGKVRIQEGSTRPEDQPEDAKRAEVESTSYAARTDAEKRRAISRNRNYR